MKRYGLLLTSIFLMAGCGTVKYVPVETVEKIVYRDSVVTRIDTLEIPVEKVVLKEVLPMVDTSYLETDLASSEAFIDTTTRRLNHTLIQKDTVLAPEVEFKEVVKIVEKEVLKEVPVEIIKERKVVPVWCWWLLGMNVIGLIGILVYIYLIGKRFG